MSEFDNQKVELFGSDRMWGLKELPLPDPVSWWPQTSGWYALGALIICGLVAIGWFRLQKYKRNAYRRNGQKMLTAMIADHSKFAELPFLLRHSAMQAAARVDIAGHRGKAWLDWLNQSNGSNLFLERDAELLDRLVYGDVSDQQIAEADINRLILASKKWIGSHRVSI